MSYDDAVDVVGMLVSAFPGERAWDANEIRMYAQAIERLDASVATKTVVRAQASITRRPSVSEFLSIARSVEAGLKANAPPTRETREKWNPRDLPTWVGRWVVARKQGDFRRFKEQGDWGDPRLELMPDGLYADEAQEVTVRDALTVVGAPK